MKYFKNLNASQSGYLLNVLSNAFEEFHPSKLINTVMGSDLKDQIPDLVKEINDLISLLQQDVERLNETSKR
jgi:uncharacterized small protein (DUF1192 family)